MRRLARARGFLRAALVTLAAAASFPLTSLPAPAAQNPKTAAMRVAWGPFKDLSPEQMDALGESSKAPDAGTLLPSGVRVIDLVVGSGPEPERGDRVYVHYKLWANGFRAQAPADISFLDNRPYDWVLGSPTDRMPPGADEGVLGMREGGWRRVVVPGRLAFGEAGLKRGKRGIGGVWSSGPKAPYAIEPMADAYYDFIMFDGGSGRCAKFLRPPDVSETAARKLKSLTCSAKMEMY